MYIGPIQIVRAVVELDSLESKFQDNNMLKIWWMKS